MPDIDLNFIARQLERVLTEIGGLRDEIRVQGAMIQRLDGSMSALLQEMQDTRAICRWVAIASARSKTHHDRSRFEPVRGHVT